MKTRVGIIGTSSSIMVDGWRDAFEKAAPEFEVVANASLGSSHPAMLPYRLPLLEDAGLDVLIVDLCVNEQRALNRNLHNPDWAAKYFNWLRGWCAERGILPVFLILPMLTHEGLNASAVADRWSALCREAGLPFFDSYRLLRHACFYTRLRPRQFFMNAHHLNARGAVLVSEALARTLSRFLLHSWIGGQTEPVHDFRFVHAGGQEPRETALLSERMLVMSLGQARQIDTGPGDVAGVVLDMSRSNGALLITGRQSLVKRLDSPYVVPDSPPRVVAWSLIDTVAAADGHVALSVQPSRLLAGQEDNDHSVPDTAPETDDPKVEIAGLVLRGPVTERRLISVEGADPDLLNLLD